MANEAGHVEPSLKVRCFVALHLPEYLQDTVLEFQQKVRAAVGDNVFRFTERKQMHLTLKFFGHIPAGAVESLTGALADLCATAAPFDLALSGFGAFPSLRKPRVLWLGFQGQVEELRSLQLRINASTSRWSAHEETREFQPHLTLGRIRDARSRPRRSLEELLSGFQFSDTGAWRVESIVLMQSLLSPQGVRYVELASFNLR